MPDSFYTFMVDQDSFVPKHIGNHSVSDSAVIGNQSDDCCTDLAFVAAFYRFIPETVAVDLYYPANPSFCHMMFIYGILKSR